MPELRDFLNNIDNTNEEVILIIPNTGRVGTTFWGSNPVTGLNGYAVIVREKNSSRA